MFYINSILENDTFDIIFNMQCFASNLIPQHWTILRYHSA